MGSVLDVAVVGAGPYGLSIAAHLQATRAQVRIFGRPMQTWSEHMPSGTLLKSDGFASNLSDPHRLYTLSTFCKDRAIPYDDRRLPVSVETFIHYGLHFQQHLLPDLDQRDVVRLERSTTSGRFLLRTEDDATFEAKRVVLAVGIRDFAYTPEALREYGPDLVSHSSAHHGLDRFRGESVIVLGSGASAVDLAILLAEKGAKVCILSRRPKIVFHDPPPAGRRSFRSRIRNPSTGLGPGWKSWVFCNAPEVFRSLPAGRRQRIVEDHLGPAGSWAMRNRLHAGVRVVNAVSHWSAEKIGAKMRLTVRTADGEIATHTASHVIAATGYRPDLRRLPFLDEDLLAGLAHTAHAPTLTANFESSLPGLYFVGLASATSFGPMMRFAFGSEFTARRLGRHLGRAMS